MDPVYLYGDATPSPLQGDFIAFLRDAFDFAVQALLCCGRVDEASERAAKLGRVTEADVDRAERLALDVTRVLEQACSGDDDDSLTARFARRVRNGLSGLLRAEIDTARAGAAAEGARAAEVSDREREMFFRAFEGLLLRHSLPDSIEAVEIVLGGDGRYAAKLHGCASYGAEWTVALEVPPAHPFARTLRLDRLVERLDVDAPEAAGWIHKEVKVRTQRFDRLHLTELVVDPVEARVALRAAADGSGSGYDLTFARDTGRVQLARVAEGSDEADAPQEVGGADHEKLLALRDRLIAAATELIAHKASLLAATLDDTPLTELAAPRGLVDRFLASIAPEVKRIAQRSPTPNELAIKRQVADNHREELYVSKAELEEKLSALSPALRSAFDTLGLWATAQAAAEPFALLRAPGPALPFTVPSPAAPSYAPPPDGDAHHDSTRELVALSNGVNV